MAVKPREIGRDGKRKWKGKGKGSGFGRREARGHMLKKDVKLWINC